MSREPHIPLFLWIATAILAHAIWGGGAHQAAVVLEETLNISAFAREVQRHVRLHSVPVEVTLLDESEEPSLEVEERVIEADVDEAEESDTDQTIPDEQLVEKKEEEKKRKEEEEKKAAEEEKKEKEEETTAPPEQVVIEVPNRIAIEQHVKDENQEDNPDANHIAEHANRVEEETRARITSTDQNSQQPNPGEQHDGPEPEPGNADETRVAQSEDAPGEPNLPPGGEESTPAPPAAAPPVQASAPPSGGPKPRAPRAVPPAPALPEQPNVPHVHDHGSGRWSMARPLDPQPPQKALPRRQAQNPTDLLGLGAAGTTKNGVNLNLTPQMAVAAVGADQMSRERQLDGQRRRSAHRGSWKSLGIERWKPALENYVASVKFGDETALNAARVPFARYLNHIHLKLHPIFADHFLSSLDALPGDHPLNRSDMKTHLEIVLSKEDGRIVRMGVTKSSGATAFDVGALDSVQRASPFGPPPDAIVSPDGNVYLHWEFHRQPHFACSTYFAKPIILKKAPETAPPRVTPPRSTPPDEQSPYAPSPRPGERSGFLDGTRHPAPQPRG